MKSISVRLSGGRTYPVQVGSGALAQVAHHAADVNAVITNATVHALYGEQLLNALRQGGKAAFVLTMPDGEAHKNMHTLQTLLDGMLAKKMGRDGGVIALGGGVVGDVAGFAAAVYMRGIPIVQIPTTLLAQADAAIGGKTGVNHTSGKNLIGAFHQPRAVLADSDVLRSLPPREYRAGLAEVIKYGLLGNADFFSFLEKHRQAIAAGEATVLEDIISASVQMKADIVTADEEERSGQRALLNLGHTFAHAAEAVISYDGWLHGEAVAFGLVAAAKLSEKICGFAPADTARIIALLADWELPVRTPDSATPDALQAAMGIDKKKSGGKQRFILMHAIGSAFVGNAADAAVREVLEDMQ